MQRIALPTKQKLNTWLTLPAQPVDATPSNELIRQYFPLENRSVRLYSIRPSQGGVPFESTLANELLAVEPLQVDFELVLRRHIEIAVFTRHVIRPERTALSSWVGGATRVEGSIRHRNLAP